MKTRVTRDDDIRRKFVELVFGNLTHSSESNIMLGFILLIE